MNSDFDKARRDAERFMAENAQRHFRNSSPSVVSGGGGESDFKAKGARGRASSRSNRGRRGSEAKPSDEVSCLHAPEAPVMYRIATTPIPVENKKDFSNSIAVNVAASSTRKATPIRQTTSVASDKATPIRQSSMASDSSNENPFSVPPSSNKKERRLPVDNSKDSDSPFAVVNRTQAQVSITESSSETALDREEQEPLDYFSQHFTNKFKEDQDRSRDSIWFYAALVSTLVLLFTAFYSKHLCGYIDSVVYKRIIDVTIGGEYFTAFNSDFYNDDLNEIIISFVVCYSLLLLGRYGKALSSLCLLLSGALPVVLMVFAYYNDFTSELSTDYSAWPYLPVLATFISLCYSFQLWSNYNSTKRELNIAARVLSLGASEVSSNLDLFFFNILIIMFFSSFVLFLSDHGPFMIEAFISEKTWDKIKDDKENFTISSLMKNPVFYLIAVYTYVFVTSLLSFSSMTTARTIVDRLYETPRFGAFSSARCAILRFVPGSAVRSSWDFIKNFLHFSECPLINMKVVTSGMAVVNYDTASSIVNSIRKSDHFDNKDSYCDVKSITNTVSKTLFFLYIQVYVLLIWYIKLERSNVHTCTSLIIFFICYFCLEQWRAATMTVLVASVEESNLYSRDVLMSRKNGDYDEAKTDSVEQMRIITSRKNSSSNSKSNNNNNNNNNNSVSNNDDASVDPTKTFIRGSSTKSRYKTCVACTFENNWASKKCLKCDNSL